MPYPPALPPSTRTNATAQADNHPADHNALVAAQQSVLDELGTGPKGDAASLTDRLSGFTKVNGVMRDANAAWGVQSYKASRNGDPAQIIPYLTDTTVQFSTFGPVTARHEAGRTYRIEGTIGINSNTGGISWTFSLLRSDVATGPVYQLSQSVTLGDVIQVPFQWYATVEVAGNVTWTLRATCNGTAGGTGRLQHSTGLAINDIGKGSFMTV